MDKQLYRLKVVAPDGGNKSFHAVAGTASEALETVKPAVEDMILEAGALTIEIEPVGPVTVCGDGSTEPPLITPGPILDTEHTTEPNS